MAGHKRRSEILAVGTHLAKTCPSTQVGQRETRKLDNNSIGTVKSFPSSSSQEHNATGLVKDKTGEGVFEHPPRTEDHEKSVLDTQQTAAKNPAGEKLTYTSPPSPLLDLSSPPPCPPIDHRLESLGRYNMSNCWEVLIRQCPTLADTFYSFIHSVTLHKIHIPDDHKRRLEVLLMRIHKLSSAQATQEAQRFLDLSGKYEDLSLPVYIPLEEKKCSLLPTRLSLSPQAEEYPVPIPRPLKPPIAHYKPIRPPQLSKSTPVPTHSPATRQQSNNTKTNAKNQGGRNAQGVVAQALGRAQQDVKGQADGLKEAAEVLREEAEETKKLEKRKKDYEAAISKLNTRYFKNLAQYLTRYWGRHYYTDSVALRDFVSRLNGFGLDLELSRRPDVVLGMLINPASFPDPDNAIVHVLNTSVSVHPHHANHYTPFYDQSIPQEYTRMIVAKYPRIDWADAEQGAFCSSAHKPDWVDIPRLGFSQVPLSFPGKLLPGRIAGGTFFTDTLLRKLIKPNRTFSEMGFSANVQTILANENRPTYCEWHYPLLNEAVLSGYHDNALMYNIRTSFGNRRHTYDDCTVESCTGVKIAGYGFSFQGVEELKDEVLEPRLQVAQDYIKEKTNDVISMFTPPNPPDPPEPPPPPPAAPMPVVVAPEIPLPIVDVSHAPLPAPLNISDSNVCVNAVETCKQWGSSLSEQASDLYGRICECPFTAQSRSSMESFLEFIRNQSEQLQGLADWWSSNASALVDISIEKFLEIICPILATWFDLLNRVQDTRNQLQFFIYGRMLWTKLFEYSDVVIAAQLGVPHSLYVKSKTYFLTRCEVISALVKREELSYIPNVLFNSNYCPSLREKLDIPKQLISERSLVDAEPGFYSEPMCVSWQECTEMTPLGPVSLEEYGKALDYDENRIIITLTDHHVAKPGKFSELHYGLFMQQGRCYGQNYLLTCTKKRLGRSIESPEDSAIAGFHQFVKRLHMPPIEIVHEQPCVTRSEYVTYVERMPAGSRQKHLDYFDSLSQVNNDDKDKPDGAFVKADEMIANPKGRGIINPPPSVFYDLVVGITMIKKALRRELFNLIYDEECAIYFTYGADMTADEKSAWFKKVQNPVGEKPTAYILIGGDDNGTVIYYNGENMAWESDVTACDQSHSRPLVMAMAEAITNMMLPAEWIEKLLASYQRPIRTAGFSVKFLEWQLHTGHPQTSTCNSLLVALMGAYLLVIFFRRLLSHQRAFPTDARGVTIMESDFDFEAKKLGMIWKNQFMLDVLDLTFHKGCWMPCEQGLFQWVPLPSCLWKSFKIRTDQKLSNQELLLRLAFNLYQKLINPNMSFVQAICQKQFNYIITQVLKMKGDPRYAFQNYFCNIKAGSSMARFLDQQYAKNGELAVLNDQLNRGPSWGEVHEINFCLNRYRCTPDDLIELLEAGNWDGSFGVLVSPFLQTAIFRDYMSTHSEFEDQIDNHLQTVPDRILEYL